MLRLRRNPELPELVIQLLHEVVHGGTDGTEVVILELLPLRRLRPEERAPAVDEILALAPERLVDKEVFLLRAYTGADTFNLIIAEQVQDTKSLFI